MLHKLNIAPHTDSIHWLLAGVCVCVCVRCAADVLLVWSTTHSQSAGKKHIIRPMRQSCTHIDTYPLTQPFGLLADGLAYDHRANINSDSQWLHFDWKSRCFRLWYFMVASDAQWFCLFSQDYVILCRFGLASPPTRLQCICCRPTLSFVLYFNDDMHFGSLVGFGVHEIKIKMH